MGELRIPVHKLRLKDPGPPAGMDVVTLISLVWRLRKTSDDWDPITVRSDGDGWIILDGRHRWMASVIAGRPDVLAQVSS